MFALHLTPALSVFCNKKKDRRGLLYKHITVFIYLYFGLWSRGKKEP